MSNITARKGLAFGALVALGSTLLTGVPAHAAAGVTLAPAAGTSYNLPAGYAYELRATASSEIPTDRFDEFKFKVTNVDGKSGSAQVSDGGAGGFWDWSGTYDLAGDAGSSVVIPGYAVNNGTIWIDSNTTDATSHFVVTAFLDADGDDAVDAGELAGTQTLNFLRASELTATTTVTTPIYAGDTSVAAKSVLTNVNIEQFYDWNEEIVYVEFKSNTDVLGVANGSLSSGTWSASLGSLAGRTKGQVISAQAWIYVGGELVKVGAANTTSVIAHTVNHIDIEVPATVNSHTDGDIAKNSTFTVTLTANDVVDGEDVAVPGAKLAVEVDASTFNALSADNGVSITVNGVKYTSYSSLPGVGDTAALSLTADAKGQVVLTVSSTGLVEGDDIGFFASTEGSVTSYLWTTQQDRDYRIFADNSEKYYETYWFRYGYDAAAGAATSVEAIVYDQFGAVLPDGYNAIVTVVGSDRATTDAPAGDVAYASIVGGKVTVSVPDTGAGNGLDFFDVNVLKRDSVNGGYTGGSIADMNFGIERNDAIDRTPVSFDPILNWNESDLLWSIDDKGVGTPTGYGSENTPAGLTTADFSNYDSRKVLGTEPDVAAFDGISGTGTFIAFIANSATWSEHVGIGVANAKVTFSGEGLLFKTVNDAAGQPGGVAINNYSIGSTTTYTNLGGYVGVVVWSHKSGLNTFTATSGSAKQTFTFYVAPPASDSGANVVLSAPVYSLPAKFIEASATVTDKFGNVVPDAPLKLAVKGLGWDNYNWYTGDDGKVTYNLSTGLNDLGTLTWTATLDANSYWGDSSADDIVKTATTVVALGAPVPADAKVSVSSAATSQSGRAVDVTVTVTTAAGVAIPGAIVALSSTGAGYLGATSATTDANGKVAVKLVAGESETGDATVTATAGAVSASAKTSFGVTDANINLAGKRVTVDWSFAAGKRVVIYRNGIQIRNFVAASDASDSFSFNLKKGTRKIAVKVGGVTIDSQTYVIK